MIYGDPDYWLTSSESYMFKEPRKCWKLKNFSCGTRTDLALIKIEPIVIYRDRKENEEILDKVLVAARLAGMNIFTSKEWPVYVYIAIIKSPIAESAESLKRSDIEVIAWGELYSSDFYKNLQRTNS